jgi:hypothetical protein
MRETRPGRVPPQPRGDAAHTTGQMTPAAAAASQRHAPHPAATTHPAGLTLTRLPQRFTHVHPSGLPLTCDHRMERRPLGLNSKLRTPPLPATHVRAGTGTEHSPGATSLIGLQQRAHSTHATSCRTTLEVPSETDDSDPRHVRSSQIRRHFRVPGRLSRPPLLKGRG